MVWLSAGTEQRCVVSREPKLRLRGAGLAIALAVLSACAAANGQGTAPGEDVAAATASTIQVPVAPLPGVRPSTVPPPAPFTAMTFNIQAYNTAVDAIRDAVLASGAAVVALQEYRAGTHAGLLAQLAQRYPHQVTCLRGVVVLATFAPRDQGCVEIGDTQARDIAWMRVDGPGGPWTFASVHFSRPSFTTGLGQLLGAEEGAPEQAAQFEQLGTFVLDREQDSTVVVMGDFNAEPGWPHFGAFLERTGLATGPDLPTTRVVAGIGFAIDQVLAGPGAAVEGVRAGPDAGSDHLPVIAEIRPLPAGSTAQP